MVTRIQTAAPSVRRLVVLTVLSLMGCGSDPVSPIDPLGLMLVGRGDGDQATRLDPTSEIFIIGPSGTFVRRLTMNGFWDGDAVWSPDGRRIAFASERETLDDGSWISQIYIMDTDGSNERRITDLTFGARSPSWSPDGSKILFETFDGPPIRASRRIWVMDSDGSNPRLLIGGDLSIGSPQWSPDGSEILFVSRATMFRAQADGSAPQSLAAGACLYRASDARWSPDAAHVVYTCDAIHGPGIFIARADGTQPRRITPAGTPSGSVYDFGGIWSPDGRQIAFTSARGETMDLYITDVSDGTTTRVTSDASLERVTDWRQDR